MRQSVPVLALALAASALGPACKSAEDKEAARFCEKVEAARAATWSESERDLCAAQYKELAPAARSCVQTCASNAEPGPTLLACNDDCFGMPPLAMLVCEKEAADVRPCMAHYDGFQRTQPHAYSCVARCIERADGAVAIAACHTRCNVPAPPPAADGG